MTDQERSKMIKEKLLMELEKMHEIIMKKEIEILDCQTRVEEKKKEVETREMYYTIDIISIKDELNKPKFSNETSRNAELKRLLNIDTEYQNSQRV